MISEQEAYNRYVKSVTPTTNKWMNSLRAFLVGGIICMIGQAAIQIFLKFGLEKEEAGAYATLFLIFLSVLLTGLNIYPKIAKFGGAGTLVPITGFANSVVAPAIEYKKEGQVFGIGCKIFTIAGPVILYGIMSSFVTGILYWFFSKVFGS